MTVKLNADGSVTFNGTATDTCYINFPTMPLTPGTYTLSGGAALPTGCRLVARNADVVSQLLVETSSTVPSKAFTISAVIKTLVFIAVPSGTSFSNITIYPQLETGSTATAYELYAGWTTPLADADTLDLATGVHFRQWERLELSGEETWTTGTVTADNQTERYYSILLPAVAAGAQASGSTIQFYCTHFRTQTARFVDRVYIANYGKQVYFYCSELTEQTVDAWTSWLQAQSAAGTPVTILYRRLEPEVTQGEARSLSQSDGTLNVSATEPAAVYWKGRRRK